MMVILKKRGVKSEWRRRKEGDAAACLLEVAKKKRPKDRSRLVKPVDQSVGVKYYRTYVGECDKHTDRQTGGSCSLCFGGETR